MRHPLRNFLDLFLHMVRRGNSHSSFHGTGVVLFFVAFPVATDEGESKTPRQRRRRKPGARFNVTSVFFSPTARTRQDTERIWVTLCHPSSADPSLFYLCRPFSGCGGQVAGGWLADAQGWRKGATHIYNLDMNAARETREKKRKTVGGTKS